MTTSLLETLTGLQQALDELARALIVGDAERVLRAEEPLGTAVTDLGRVSRRDLAAADPRAADAAIDAVRGAMARCRTLGETTSALQRAIAPEDVYGRRGAHLAAPPAPRR